jgi:hypothetical protein
MRKPIDKNSTMGTTFCFEKQYNERRVLKVTRVLGPNMVFEAKVNRCHLHSCNELRKNRQDKALVPTSLLQKEEGH